MAKRKRKNAGLFSKRQTKKFLKKHRSPREFMDVVKSRSRATKAKRKAKRTNPATSLRGWVGAKAVKIVKDAKGRAVKVLIQQ